MLLRHVSGAVTVAECTYENRRLPGSGVETLIEIEGPTGAIAIDAGCRLTLTDNGQPKTYEIKPPPLAWADPTLHVVQESVVQTCAHVLSALRARREAATSGADNLKTFALVEAAYQAAAEQRAIEPRAWKREAS
jgi:predicted dehydrogenase